MRTIKRIFISVIKLNVYFVSELEKGNPDLTQNFSKSKKQYNKTAFSAW